MDDEFESVAAVFAADVAADTLRCLSVRCRLGDAFDACRAAWALDVSGGERARWEAAVGAFTFEDVAAWQACIADVVGEDPVNPASRTEYPGYANIARSHGQATPWFAGMVADRSTIEEGAVAAIRLAHTSRRVNVEVETSVPRHRV